ncbi:hypothetical protein ABID19_005033 [Mesorhizobium robiniae]|uniref:Uncharacterized protein n=1 Tax=Mesorhizobium robiniae TaxID=559315 RepID=A0ABV2GUJ7_9HYPH
MRASAPNDIVAFGANYGEAITIAAAINTAS